jgi:hypothetical protein
MYLNILWNVTRGDFDVSKLNHLISMPLNLLIIRVLLLFVAVISFSLSGCKDQEDIQRPDVSHIAMDTEIRRFDQAMMAMDTSAMEAEMERIDEAYGEFATLYFGQILGPFILILRRKVRRLTSKVLSPTS